MKIQWHVAVQVWWSYAWRCVVYSVIPTILLIVLGEVFLPVTGHQGWLLVYRLIVWYAVGIPISVVAMNHTIEVHLTRLAGIANSGVS
jgi:hypothetical protein